MNKRVKYSHLMLCLATAMAFLVSPASAWAKDKIVIGTAISLSGPYAPGAAMTQIPNYKMWVAEVNARGGIYVKKYGKRLPVKLIIYDDRSNIGTAVRLVERLILQEKVDFLLPPWGTAMHFAVAPVANKYGYPLIGPTLSSEKLREVAPKLPYFFGILNMPREQARSLIDLLVELGVKRVAIIYVADAYGIEWTGQAAPYCAKKGIKVVIKKSYPLGAKDLSPLLKQVKAAKVDALLGFSYPPDTFLITKQSIAIGLNPKLFYLGVGVAFPVYTKIFKTKVVQGVMGAGAWNPRVPYAGAKSYFERHLKRWKTPPDRWASAFTWASLQILQQAIEKVGSLDRKKIRDYIASHTFQTVIGPVRFKGGFNIHSPGDIGQWQSGRFEVVAPKAKRTAKPIYPKPRWPK